MTLKVTEDLLDKSTPVDDDKIVISDSADLETADPESGKLKRLSWANTKVTLKAYFDTLYGDVVGPASATDNAVVRYNTTTGKLIQNSGVIIDDSNNVTGLGTLNGNAIATGTNTGDQTDLTGVSDTKANFDTACSDGNFVYTGDDITGKSASTDALNSATTTVDVSAATAPTTGQVLTATSSTAATWQTQAGGGDMSASTYDPATIAEQLVGITATQTLTNKTLTAPVISSISNTGTITLPTSTDTLVGKATTDTLTNKTFDANGTGNSLSNVDVADLANGTDGELITWDAAGAPATVAVGTSGHVLTSNGAGAAPTFQAASGGGGGYAETTYIAGTILDETLLWEGPIGAATTLSAGYIGLTTAPTGSSFIVTVAKSTDDGATYPTTETVTLTATNKYVKGTLTTAFSEGDWIKATVTQVGSTVAGSNLYFKAIGS